MKLSIKTIVLFILTLSLGLPLAAQTDFEPPLSDISESELKKYEASMLVFYKNLSPKELQDKYFLAATKFTEVGNFPNALYLLGKGLTLAPPSVLYVKIYLSLLERIGNKQQFSKVFETYIAEEEFKPADYEDLSELALLYLGFTKTLSTDLKNPSIKKALKQPENKAFVSWSDAVAYARQANYKEPLKLLSDIKMMGEDESIFFAFLQKMNKKIPKYCMKMESFPEMRQRSSYKKTCEILLSTNHADIPERIKKTEEIDQYTALYEVLFE